MARQARGAHAAATGSNAGGAVRKKDVLAFVFSYVLALAVLAPALAGAVTINTTTARSNESTTGNSILGGIPTRVTWEGYVGDDEDISSIEIVYPSGSSFSGATATPTILNGLDRVEVGSECEYTSDSLKVTFDEPVPSGALLRLEMFDVTLPAEGGDIVLTGTYTTSSGEQKQLPDSPSISVVKSTLTERIVSWLDQQDWVAAWNSNKFCNMFLKPQLIVSAIPSLFFGWLRALALVLIGFPLAIPLGLAVSFLKMSKVKILHVLASIYVNIIRGTPLFLQIYIAFFGFPLLGLNVNEYVLGFIVLAINSSAYLAEIFRAGIQSIQRGQFEAAWSLGMTKAQAMFYVIIPQTVRRVIPTMTSEFVLLYKDSSLLSSVGVMELMMYSKSLTATTGNITPYIVAAMYYLIVTLPLIHVVNVFEAKLAASDGTGASSGGDSKATKKSRKRMKVTNDPEPLSLTGAAHDMQ